MTGYEVMLSESQERMLLVAAPEHVSEVSAVFEKWDVPCYAVGVVTEEQTARVTEGAATIAAAPIPHLADAPRYRLTGQASAESEERQRLRLSDVPQPAAAGLSDANQVLLRLLASPNIASRQNVYRQYDHQVQTNTVVGPGAGDAAVLRVKETDKAIAVAIDGNGRQCFLAPHRGGQRVVAEVTRNLSCVGAEPLALTDCLNFGNRNAPTSTTNWKGVLRAWPTPAASWGCPWSAATSACTTKARARRFSRPLSSAVWAC